jgi:hypothetical protein
MGSQATTTIDFGAFPGQSDASVTVTGQSTIGSASLVEAWIYPLATADHTADEHMVETIKAVADASTIVTSSGFTIRAFNTSQLNEPVIMMKPDADGTRGESPAMLGGVGTRLYGVWTVAWVWV